MWIPHNITEYFFFDHTGFLNINDRIIFECYEELTEIMKQVYTSLRNIIMELTSHLTEEEMGEIDLSKIAEIAEKADLRGLEYYLD